VVLCPSTVRIFLFEIDACLLTSVCSRWSFGSSRIQVDADLKVLSEFLSSLQNDTIRGYPPISSLTNLQTASRTPGQNGSHLRPDLFSSCPGYVSRLKNINMLLRFLVEDEIYRLTVWSNPTHDAKRGTDHLGTTERTMTDVRPTFAPL
jgi:phosphatidylinositol 4-kinase